MTTPVTIDFTHIDLDVLGQTDGALAVLVPPDAKLDRAARRLNRLTRGALVRLLENPAWEKITPGDGLSIGYPAGMAAKALHVVKVPRQPDLENARKAGATLAGMMGADPLMLVAGSTRRINDVALGLLLKSYAFLPHKTRENDNTPKPVQIMAADPEAATNALTPTMAVAEGVFFTRDLVNEPANVLTTDEFAARLADMRALGMDVEVLEEDHLTSLGMGALLGVGQGSDNPSKIVVMHWNGGGDDAPLALIGKGVVFDTGGISLKPANGMEEMTMDMGGAGVVAGVMRTLALRKARANVVGVVGLVENMPDARAQRPGDVVTSMKGDTIEVINTDAEGRLVLADVMWYTQDRFAPSAMLDLATLTGAIIIGLGHENAGVFSNNDTLCDAFLRAAHSEGEGAWRLPMGQAYDDMLKSRIADIRNVSSGRAAGSITAAQFLGRFVKDGTPWIHIDIAGVAFMSKATTLSPKGATGWGVMAIDRLVRDRYETVD